MLCHFLIPNLNIEDMCECLYATHTHTHAHIFTHPLQGLPVMVVMESELAFFCIKARFSSGGTGLYLVELLTGGGPMEIPKEPWLMLG